MKVLFMFKEKITFSVMSVFTCIQFCWSNMHHPSFGQSLFPGASSTSIKYLSIPCAFSCTVLALSNYNDLDCYLLLVFLLLPPVPYPTAFPPPRPQPTALLVPPEPPPHPPHPPPASPGDPQ